MASQQYKYVFRSNMEIHPGEILQDTLDASGMSQSELAERIGLTTKTVNEIVKGKNSITPETALKLSSVFGTSDVLWNNLQRQYEEVVARKHLEKEMKNEKNTFEKYNDTFRELVKHGYIESGIRDIKEKIMRLFQFFGVSSLAYVETVQGVAYRQSDNQKYSQENLAAWLRCGEVEAKKISLADFDRDKILSELRIMKDLTIELEESFWKKLVDICANAGIAVVYVPYFKNTHVNGATRWLDSNRALILISSRGKTRDIFWFTFFHELGHVVKHGKRQEFIEFEKPVVNGLEEEANKFAEDVLISSNAYEGFKKRIKSVEDIRKFAAKEGVAPDIVAGRLAREFGAWKSMSSLRKNIDFSVFRGVDHN